ncbi:MAG: helix-turn-helix transcriptional regulator [Brachymonas sp.]|nr:helix-turn-helix transcriptional regulator [Brachymonas sp.]
MVTLRAWLASDEALHKPLEAMARQMGMHITTMQRQFRAAFGMTAGQFMRECRLQSARRMLESGSTSVKKAAALAGYTSAANFATAYKRRFKITPRQASPKSKLT